MDLYGLVGNLYCCFRGGQFGNGSFIVEVFVLVFYLCCVQGQQQCCVQFVFYVGNFGLGYLEGIDGCVECFVFFDVFDCCFIGGMGDVDGL